MPIRLKSNLSSAYLSSAQQSENPARHTEALNEEEKYGSGSNGRGSLNSSTGINKRIKRDKSNSRLRHKLSDAISNSSSAHSTSSKGAAKEYNIDLHGAPAYAASQAHKHPSSYRSSMVAPPGTTGPFTSHAHSHSLCSEENAAGVYSSRLLPAMRHSGSSSSLSHRARGPLSKYEVLAVGSAEYNPHFMAQFM